MKTAAMMTSRVMDAIGRLPGIATLDWCDRAASALTRMHAPSFATVALASIDARGTIERLEAAGAAECHDHGNGNSNSGHATAIHREHAPDSGGLGALRSGWQEGEWIGWSPASLSDGSPWVSTAGALGLSLNRGDTPTGRRWQALHPTDLVLGAIQLPGSGSRVLLAELGSTDSSFKATEREQAIMVACLPALCRRLLAAIGDDPPERHKWLTPREELILWYLVAGKKVPQIARELHRSVYTVHDHVKSLHRKLGASNRGQLVARALGHLGSLNNPVDDLTPDTANI